MLASEQGQMGTEEEGRRQLAVIVRRSLDARKDLTTLKILAVPQLSKFTKSTVDGADTKP